MLPLRSIWLVQIHIICAPVSIQHTCTHIRTHSDPYSLIWIISSRHLDLWVSSLSQESVWWWRFIVPEGQDLQSSPSVLHRAPEQQLSEYTRLCVFIWEKRLVKPTLTEMFLLGGRHSVDTIIFLFYPFVLKSGERVNPVGWDVTSPKFAADQIAFLAWFSSVPMCVNQCVCVWIVTDKTDHHLGFRSNFVSLAHLQCTM